ncbi:MAG: ATP synthase gamma chain [Candidatus Amesbacteria bacterium GW2011_GWB1_47_19]|nr:MAG: ATP synthase gamma chain [Candidatus Amesbacteria bacterium GW2011_GWA1_44_24]KKU31517.1 MAG: ATP synthase gamma chain [Candidatus Amesbacteria bacterium GW2011_GWC1_46_24]KKU67525.1 MAG: ATP synthase gamma chain [Candidatus Amesbacteria bacterium GW2011_GWB1_47_19]OGD06206.1 MAG: hypothetical protein A2379_01370 [Candidatus Amesbacteria bacterium RIFOXYB1_FULL_47_13]HBC72537.1 hypothetical protein [Candidatus Amesbacteria bacterium]
MISKKQIKSEFEGLLSLKNLVEVYEEVAAMRMQKVRGAVLQSRQFQDGLMEVFMRVKSAYRKQQIPEKALHRTNNGRSVAVFVSANAGLYGDIVNKIFDAFEAFVRKNDPDVVILGKLGVAMMSDRLPNKLYNYFDFSDEGVDQESFVLVMRYLIQFEKILVFFGKFKTLLSQEPTILPVSGDTLEDQLSRALGVAGKSDYLFEPSVYDVAMVFEGEILASMFEQALHESQLAKFASRMLALDSAVDNIEKGLVKVKVRERKMRHRDLNRGQLETISGISMWKGVMGV